MRRVPHIQTVGRGGLLKRHRFVTRKHCNSPILPRVGAFLVTALIGSALVVLGALSIVLALLDLWSVSLSLMAETPWLLG
jgi:hypothetical protein